MNRLTTILDITWFLDQNRTGQLDLNPSYQRKSVWSLKDKKAFLDTIFRNYPCPSIFIHKKTDDEGYTTYHVVDGKQRLETIIQFYNNEISIANDFGDENLNGKKFNNLSIQDKQHFWNYKLSVESIDVADSMNDVFNRLGKISIHEVFNRLNSVSKNLNKQELRHAVFGGWFINEAEEEVEEELWKKIKFATKAKSKRMQDVQFISELLAIIIEKEITGFDHEYIDHIYTKYDDKNSFYEQLDEDVYIEEKNRIKDYIAEMVDHSPDITKWIKRQINLYTLWAFLALSDSKLPIPVVTRKYKMFMEKVDSITEELDPQNLRDLEQQAYTYHSNARGASSDFKPRNERLKALKSIMVNYENSRLS